MRHKALRFKKMAGTSAVFISEDYQYASPVEKDGLIWGAEELGFDDEAVVLAWKSAIENSLALEGLEDYDPPSHGDARYVHSHNLAFVYIERAKAWVQLVAI